MSKFLPVPAAILLGACAVAASAQSRESLAVIFEVELGQGGEVRTLKVDHVADGSGATRRVEVPQAYLEAARDSLQARYRGKAASRFFTYTLYDPARPNDADLGAGNAPPADPRRTVSLAPGQTATLRLGPGGRLEIIEQGIASEAPASQIEEALARGMASGAIGRSEGGMLPAPTLKHLPPTPVIRADAVRLTLKEVAGGGTSLMVENGYDQMLYYRAWMRTGERGAATSVCEAMPKLPTYEHWPHPIDGLDLTGFGLRAPDPEGAECR